MKNLFSKLNLRTVATGFCLVTALLFATGARAQISINTVTPTGADCISGNNGQLEFNVSGGDNSGYNYALFFSGFEVGSPQFSATNDFTITSLSPNTYYIVIWDGDDNTFGGSDGNQYNDPGNSQGNSFTIVQDFFGDNGSQPTPSISNVSGSPYCAIVNANNLGSNPVYQAQSSPYPGTYTYNWAIDPSSSISGTIMTTTIFEPTVQWNEGGNGMNGELDVTVTDDNGCSASASISNTIGGGETLSINPPGAPYCDGTTNNNFSSTSDISFNSYNWSTDNGAALTNGFSSGSSSQGIDFTSINSGADVYLTVTDGQGCQTSAIATFSITACPISAGFSGLTPPTSPCSMDGSFTISATGGDGSGYNYQVNGPLGYSQNGSNNSFTDLDTGLYSIIVYDADQGQGDPLGFSFSTTLIAQHSLCQIVFSVVATTNASNPCSSDGSITIVVTGGGDGTNNFKATTTNTSTSTNYTGLSANNDTIIISGLPAGMFGQATYNPITVADAAAPGDGAALIQNTFTQIRVNSNVCPSPIHAVVTGDNTDAFTTCSSDGSIQIQVTSGGDGFNNFRGIAYSSTINGGFVSDTSQPFGTFGSGFFFISGLPAGTYDHFLVFDANNPNDGESQFFASNTTVGAFENFCPISFFIEDSTAATTSCSNDGSITFILSGGDGTSNYGIVAFNDNFFQQKYYFSGSSNGTDSIVFTGLPYGYYPTIWAFDFSHFAFYHSNPNNLTDGNPGGDPAIDQSNADYTLGYNTICPIIASTSSIATSTCLSADGSITVTATSGGGGFNFGYYNVTLNNDINTAQQIFSRPGSVTFGGLTAGVYAVSVTDADNPTDGAAYSANVTVVGTGCITGPNTWLGNSSDWTDGANWSSGNPPSGLCSENDSIPVPGNGVIEPVLTATESVGNISLGSGASIDLGRFNLNVCGNITGGSGATDGDVLATGGGILVLNGSKGLQQISGKVEVQSLHLNNSSGAQVRAGAIIDIDVALELEAGQFDASNGTVTLKSTSVTQAAIINNFSVNYTGTYTGNVKAERFYGPATAFNDFSQHMLGSPVSGITLAALGSNSGSSAYYEAAIGGIHNCNELLGETGTPYGKVFSFDETHAGTCIMDGWKVGASSTNVSAGTGYSVVLGNGSGTLPLTGTANLNPGYSPSTTNTGYPNTISDQGNNYTSGINLLSNPYPASLDANKLVTDNPAYFGAVYVWDVTQGLYTAATTVAPFQAFKVIKSAVGNGTYGINGTSRTTTAGTFQRVVNPIELNMTVSNTTTGLTDETTIGFNPNSTISVNPVYDLIKLPGALNRQTLYSLNSGDWMWVNVLRSISETSTVGVGLRPGVSGTYTASFDGINSFDPTSYVVLEDLQQGIMHDVRSGDYTFTSNENDNYNRFVLHFTPPASINTTDATCSEQGMINIIQPGTAMWNYTLADNNNVTLSSGTLNVNSPVSASLPAGVYTLTLKDNNGYTVVKTVQINGVQPVLASFTASANAVNVNQEVSLSSTSVNAVLNSWNFGDGTTDNGATVTHAYASEGVYNVTLHSTGASGCNSSANSTITVTRSVTGVTDLNDINNILIWSNENIVNIDFTRLTEVQANIEIYNILGQKLYEDKYVTSTVYHKEIPNMEEGYIVVTVKNNDAIITKKLFISNVK